MYTLGKWLWRLAREFNVEQSRGKGAMFEIPKLTGRTETIPAFSHFVVFVYVCLRNSLVIYSTTHRALFAPQLTFYSVQVLLKDAHSVPLKMTVWYFLCVKGICGVKGKTVEGHLFGVIPNRLGNFAML